jgi:hypothetical protein
MSPILRAAVLVVTLALICYTVGVLTQQRRHAVTRLALAFLLAGVTLDITATALMIASSGKWMTLHGAIGYSALAAMLADTWWAWRHRTRHGDAATPRWLHLFTRGAYAWWVVAFITGGMLAARG